ncbi:hypothetical protein MZM54_05125 [[Brevibacterium] frigoritolerans]|nr:hypothetical protein [Peribacillus frigoritolerans]
MKKILFVIVSLLAIVVIIAVMLFSRNSASDISPKEYKEKVNELSNGNMKLENIRVKKGKAIEETITADLDEKFLVMNFANDEKIESMSLGNKTYMGEMNEIDFGHFAKYADVLIQIAEPDLSEKERSDLLNNQLQFESIVFSGEEKEKQAKTKNANYTFITGDNLYHFVVTFNN